MNKLGGKNWMLVLQEDGDSAASKNIISNSAIQYLVKGKVPIDRAFSTRKRETTAANALQRRGLANAVFSPLRAGCLAAVAPNDKLFVIAHANEDEVGPFSPRNLAGMLKAYGMQHVGLVTFKACNVGTGTYLEKFVAAAARQGIVVGWAKGYTGAASTEIGDDGIRLEHGAATERITTQVVVNGETVKQRIDGDARFKIVRGPLNARAAVDRYA